MQQLSPQDAQFLYMESDDNLTHVTSINIFDPSTVPGGEVVRFKEIIAHVEERLRANPMLRRKLVRVPLELDYPYWVDDEFFDLEYHIRHGRLPRPGDWRQFCIHMARYHSRPLDMNKPLWELYVLEGLDDIDGMPAGCYALAIKVHHAAVDGSSLIRFLMSLVDIDNLGTPVAPLDPAEEEESPRPSLRDMARRAAANNLRSPVRIADAILRSSPALVQSARDTISRRGGEKQTVPVTRFNGKVSQHKMFDACEFALADLKKIRQLVPGSTINDVVLAICAGGLREYLEHHDELPDDPLVAWVPINARPGGADDQSDPGNNITAMTTSLHSDEKDPVRRLASIHASTQRSKEAKSGLSARLLTDITQHVPAATQVLASRLILQLSQSVRVCNLFISNVPGPQFPVYMNGAQQVGSYGLAPLANGMGLFIGTPSYNGRMSFNIISTRELMPDIRFFAECLERSQQALLAAVDKQVGRQGAAAKKKAKAKAKGKVKTKAKVGTKTRAKTKAKPKAKASARAKAGSTAKPKRKAKPKPKQGA
ncbi:MAG: wax ester/triacylglycerol synthase family O-acyltransferase [Halieaceae bacterium]|nr:wax ester/triacylglycerol synthase family O-acyltransferase [Halieaceae bacterium]